MADSGQHIDRLPVRERRCGPRRRNDGGAACQENVLRLDIAVDDSFAVCEGEFTRHFPQN
jgi:hypothetical protein